MNPANPSFTDEEYKTLMLLSDTACYCRDFTFDDVVARTAELTTERRAELDNALSVCLRFFGHTEEGENDDGELVQE